MKDCITLNTWKTIDSRRKVKKKAQVAKPQCSKKQLQITYSELDRGVQKRARADKKEFKERLADEAEEATPKQDMATLYKITNDVSDGNVITNIVEQMQRWKNQF